MKICIQTIDESGSKKSSKIFLNNCPTTNKLISSISNEIGVHKSKLIVKLKYEPFNIRIIEDWPLHLFPIRNGSIFLVQYNEKWYDNKQQSIETLDRVKQQYQEMNKQDEQTITFLKNNKIESYNVQKYLQYCLDNILMLVRQQDLQKIALALKEIPEIVDDKDRQAQLIQFKHHFLINQIGQCGRNALHWAIHMKNIDIVSFLLIKGANPNVLTIDQTTPLQLAIKLRTYQIINVLLEHPKIDINQVTNLGTALHLAVANQDEKSVELLLKYNVDINAQNNDKQTALVHCANENIKRMVERKQNLKRIKIPNITKGNIIKIGSVLFTKEERILLINPFKDQFVLQKDVQNEQEQKYTISQINKIKSIQQKSMMMDSDLHYFCLLLKDERQLTFGLKNQNIYKKWLKAFSNSMKYQQYITYNKKIPNSQQLIQILDDHQNKIILHKRKLTENKDDISKNKQSMLEMARRQSQIPQIIIIQNDNTKSIIPIPEVKVNNNKFQQSLMISKIKIKQTSSDSECNDSFFESSKIILGSILQDPKVSTFQDNSNSFILDNYNKSIYKSIYQQEDYNVNSTVNRSQFLKFNQSSQNTLRHTIIHKKQQNISFKHFKLIKVLGNGTYGHVYLAKYNKDNNVYALKVLNKKRLIKKKSLKYAVGQVNILKKIKSPFIINMYHAFQTPNNLYISLDYCPNGDLSDLITEKGRVQQKTAMFIIAQIVLAIQQLHNKKIFYRDLKPQNVLIAEDGYIKLTDFGLSRQNSLSATFCGSPAYLSPEMLNKNGVCLSSDIYGIGCILYEMVVGNPPYYSDNLQELYENIRSGKLMFPSSLSISIKSLISKLLDRDISKRISIRDIKRHEFFKRLDWKLLTSKKIKAPIQMFFQIDDQNDNQIKLQNNQEILLDDKDYDEYSDKMTRINHFDYYGQNIGNY